MTNAHTLPENKFFVAQRVLYISVASTKQVIVTLRHHFSESRLPLLQPPALATLQLSSLTETRFSRRVFLLFGYLLL
jgi:hypothetical protein